tara:strand:+ start:1013 stop:1171 length:159 start_codon:yes stop_codon:yes gene_type:complete
MCALTQLLTHPEAGAHIHIHPIHTYPNSTHIPEKLIVTTDFSTMELNEAEKL